MSAAILGVGVAVLLFWHGSSSGAKNQPPTPPAVQESAVIPDISKTKSRLQATRDHLLTLFNPNDENSIFTVVDAIDADPSLSVDCHDVAHDLGHHAYELYGFKGAMTYDNPERVNHTSVMDMCAGGYVHGILEEASLHDPNFGEHPGDLCAGVPTSNKATCYHGVGHALMFFNSLDIAQSVSDCRDVGATYAVRCFEGVWMEAFWGETRHAGDDSLGWDTSDPLAICKAQKSDAKPACFLYAPFGYLRTHDKEYAGATRMCTDASLSESDMKFCMKGIGIVMVPHFKVKNLEQAEPYAVGLSYTEKLGFYDGVMGYGRLSGLSEDDLTATCTRLQSDTSVCMDAVVESR